MLGRIQLDMKDFDSQPAKGFVEKKAMVKKAGLSGTLEKSKRVGQRKARSGKIAAAIAELDQIRPQSAKTAEAIKLFKSWLRDESGYDEKVWPRLKKALETARARVGARRLFDA
jgi:hypothetical protein